MNWVIMPYIDNLEMTNQALQDLLNQRMLDLRVLAIDNGGREQGFPLIDSRVAYWRYRPALLSLATVWNTALTMVWAAGGQHALVVNNDVRVPRTTYQRLVEVQERTGAWFVSACNVGEAYNHEQDVKPFELFETYGDYPTQLKSKGGPDFSCYLITKECHRWFQFDEHFIPAYHEDNDYHRRLQLAGFGDKIFSVPVPYNHLGSGTLRGVEHINKGWNEKFAACQRYYVEKWGGLPHHETFEVPFNPEEPGPEPRIMLTGQGRPGHLGPWKGLFDGQAV